jgi:hypothetical protein
LETSSKNRSGGTRRRLQWQDDEHADHKQTNDACHIRASEVVASGVKITPWILQSHGSDLGNLLKRTKQVTLAQQDSPLQRDLRWIFRVY